MTLYPSVSLLSRKSPCTIVKVVRTNPVTFKYQADLKSIHLRDAVPVSE